VTAPARADGVHADWAAVGRGRRRLDRLRSGELGALPVVFALIVIWAFLQSQNENFLSAHNLTNLMLQVAAVGTIAVGMYVVLLLGEIDLSVGSVSGVAAAVMAVGIVHHSWSPVTGIAVALLTGAAIGALHGTVFALIGVPSFVVTLAGLIAWQGVQLGVLGETGSINLPDNLVTQLTSTFFTGWVAWAIVLVASGVLVAIQVAGRRARTAAGLYVPPLMGVVLRTGVVASVAIASVAVMQQDRGLPLAVLIFVGFSVVFDLLTRHTRYGRHVLAVGGNVEAARRTGVRVTVVRVSVFAISGLMAAAGGILAASRLYAVNQASGGSDTMLNAIAATVIGGTSLYGGRGSAYSPLLGMLVIGSIANGLDLLNKPSSTKFITTGIVLLLAVTLDALARRSRVASGRA
jgi:D-xylose transport system permease protein